MAPQAAERRRATIAPASRSCLVRAGKRGMRTVTVENTLKRVQSYVPPRRHQQEHQLVRILQSPLPLHLALRNNGSNNSNDRHLCCQGGWALPIGKQQRVADHEHDMHTRGGNTDTQTHTRPPTRKRRTGSGAEKSLPTSHTSVSFAAALRFYARDDWRLFMASWLAR